MALSEFKLKSTDFIGKDVKSLADKVQGDPAVLKGSFDRAAEEVLAPQINRILDELAVNGAAGIGGVTLFEGDSAGTLQDKLRLVYENFREDIVTNIGSHILTAEQMAQSFLTVSSTAPKATDDSAHQFAVGSIWIDTAARAIYFCTSAEASHAVWQKYASSSAMIFTKQFAGETGITLNHGLGKPVTDYAVSITPIGDTNATVGEVYIEKTTTTVTIKNTGSFSGYFDCLIMTKG